MNAHPPPGWYGKLASLGDFAHRRLPREWIEHCDGWLSAALRGSRAELGDAWLDVYLTAPVLRFAWAPGVIDRQWWFGVLMASCDNVGRYYPLLITQPRARPPADAAGGDHLALWFEHVGNAAMATLGDRGASVDELESALLRAPAWPATSGMGASSLESWAPWSADAQRSGRTTWWQDGTQRDSSAMRIVDGLPDGPQFLQLLQPWDETTRIL